MTMWLVGSARSSPGATTTALLLAGSVPGAVLVEADTDGGVLAVRYGLGRDPGVATLAGVRNELSSSVVQAHAQSLPGGLVVLVGPESPGRAEHLWETAGDRLAKGLGALPGEQVVVDAGRFGNRPGRRALLAAASIVVLVARPDPSELLSAAHRLRELRDLTPARVGLVVVGDGAYGREDVVEQLGCEILGTLADDRRSAKALMSGGSGRKLARSPLARSAAELARSLQAMVETTTSATASDTAGAAR